MALKVLTVILVLTACCYCADNEVLMEESRAKKKKSSVRLWAMILLFVISKVAVFKVVSVMLLIAVFQKLFTLAGVMLKYYMSHRNDKPPTVYGPPEYNSIPYSYGPPHESENIGYPAREYGLPSLSDVGGSFNSWLHNKNP